MNAFTISVRSGSGFPTTARLAGGLNAYIECCDRWADGGRIAIEWIGRVSPVIQEE